MANAKKNITLPPAVGIYCALFTPQAPPEGSNDPTPRYSVVLRYPKATAEKVLKPLRDAIMEVAAAKWGPEKARSIMANVKNPLIRDGDALTTEAPDLKGHLFVRASTKASPTRRPPGVYDAHVQPIPPEAGEDEAYSGCTFLANVTVKPYTKGGNVGVTAYLNMVQVVRKGERLDGRPSAEEEFSEVDEGQTGDDLM